MARRALLLTWTRGITVAAIATGCGGAGEGTSTTSSETTSSGTDAGAGGSGGQGGHGGGSLCVPFATEPCYSGPVGTQGVGICTAGVATCSDKGDAWGPCVGEVLPMAESCHTPFDDDCNGQVNEGGEGCICAPNSVEGCYTGPPGTEGVGACKAGTRACDDQGTAYGPCVGEVLPQAETCDTPFDDDCNGQVNEGGAGCACAPGSTMSCYTGPSGTLGVGACEAGTQACNDQGTAYGPCTGEVTPAPESCVTAQDDNCDGQSNEGCVCVPGSSTSCYTGPTGTLGVGACEAGTRTCNAQGTAYGPCTGEVTPVPESCLTAADDDCNGQSNEGCLCTPDATVSCYTGPTGTLGVGACKGGSATCDSLGTAYGPCVGQVTPAVETCSDLVDADCTGVVNDSCAAHLWSKAPGSALDDEAFGLAIDPSGDVLIGAYFQGTVDVGCGPLTSPGPGEGALLWKASPSGACIWSRVFGQNAAVRGIGSDGAGNVYVTSFFTDVIDFPGVTLTSAGLYDSYLAKFDANGVFQWARHFAGAQNQLADWLAVDAAGNVVVTGYFNGAFDMGGGTLAFAGGLDVFVAKFDTNGNHLWSQRYGDGSAQIAYGVALDPSGNVLLTGGMGGSTNFGGSTLVSAGLNDVFVVKLSPSGAHLWSKRFGDSADQLGRSIATDASGNVIVTGNLAGTVDLGSGPITSLGGADAFLLKLDPSGSTLWSKGLGGPSTQNGIAVAVDGLGNIGLTVALDGSADFGGGTLTSAGSTDTVVAKYTGGGAHLWSRRFGGAGSQSPRAIAVDPLGRWYVAGFLTGPMDIYGNTLTGGGAEDMFVLALTR
jgi:hypothetical protein